MNSFRAPMTYISRRFRLAVVAGRGALACLLALLSALLSSAPGQQPEIPLELQDVKSTVSIRADSQEKEKDTYRLRGHVEVIYQAMTLTADEASLDESTGILEARGHVTFTEAGTHLEADQVHYNVNTSVGCFTNVHGHVQAKVPRRHRMLVSENPFYVNARQVERRGESTYVVKHGRMTTCECEKKGWTISTRRARVELDNKVVSRGSLLRLFRVPVFYTPYTVNSIAQEPRQTGFLLPHIGNSSQKGLILGGGFYWAINPSADLLLGLENYSVRGLARGGLFRATPSATSDITIAYFGVNDKGGGPLRRSRAPGQSLRALGQTRDIGYGFRGVVDADYITSLAFRLTYTDSFAQAVSSGVHQTGFLTKSFDAYSISLYASRYQNFISAAQVPGNSVIIRQTPSFSFSGMDKQIGTSPLYFAFDSSAAGVGRTDPGLDTPRLSERVDVHPEVTLRTRPFLGFQFTPSASVRLTRYGTSLRGDGEGLNRLLGEFSFDLRPPSLAKVFSRPLAGRRFKHVIEPDIRYRLVRARDPETIQDVIRFDDLDILTETNEIEYSITNALLVRKDVPEGEAEIPQARELISWRLSQKYYFDPTFGGVLDPTRRLVFDPTISLTGFAFAEGRRLSPLVSVLKFAPSSNYDTELRADFDPGGGGVLNAGITSHLRRGPMGLSFTDFFINRTAALATPLAPTGTVSALPSFHLLRAVASYGDVNRKGPSGAFGLNFDLARRITLQAVGQVGYNFGCFGVDFEYRRFALGTLRRESQFRIAISLANVGSFGNLKQRERLY
jgi:LPS-assembly protein